MSKDGYCERAETSPVADPLSENLRDRGYSRQRKRRSIDDHPTRAGEQQLQPRMKR